MIFRTNETLSQRNGYIMSESGEMALKRAKAKGLKTVVLSPSHYLMQWIYARVFFN